MQKSTLLVRPYFTMCEPKRRRECCRHTPLLVQGVSRVMDVTSVSPIVSFCCPALPGFLWDTNSIPLGRYGWVAASTSCICGCSPWQATANHTWGPGRGSDNSSQQSHDSDYYATSLHPGTSYVPKVSSQRLGLSSIPPPSGVVLLPEEARLPSLVFWYRDGLFGAILINID